MKQNTALLGAYIRALRLARGWSLRELGTAAGIAHTTVDNIEHGYDPRTGRDTNLTLETLTRLAATLEIPPAWMLSCLDGTACVKLRRPIDTWHEDEREDYERESGSMREYLRLKWGRAEILFPADEGDEAAAKRFLFGSHSPTDTEWHQVIQYAKFLTQK